jgi:hypothetical protein
MERVLVAYNCIRLRNKERPGADRPSDANPHLIRFGF